MKGFNPKEPIIQRPDGSTEPGGLIVTYNDEKILLINEGSPFWTGEEPEGLRETVLEYVRKNPDVVELEPLPEPEEPLEEPEEQVDAYSFILGLMGKENDTPENKEGLKLRGNINALEKQVQDLGEHVQKVAVR